MKLHGILLSLCVLTVGMSARTSFALPSPTTTTNQLHHATAGQMSIQEASARGNTEMVASLLARHDVDAFLEACKTGRADVVHRMLSEGHEDPSADDNDAIRWASRNGYTEIVGLLLADERVDPSANDNEAIREASENGHTDIVRLLLNDSRVDPSAEDNYAIRWASRNGRTEIVELIQAAIYANEVTPASAAMNHLITKPYADALPNMPYDTDACPICSNDYKEDDSVSQIPSCKHAFHKGCILAWFRYVPVPTCPSCRIVV